MGFRSTFTSREECPVHFPAWFVEKYKDELHFGSSALSHGMAPISLKNERKFCDLVGIFRDIQQNINWGEFERKVRGTNEVHNSFMIVVLHECGGVTRVHITRDQIRYTKPTAWEEVKWSQHSDACGAGSDACAHQGLEMERSLGL